MQQCRNFIVLFLVLITLWGCETNSKKHRVLADFIPKSSQTVLKIKNWETTREDFKKNLLIGELENDPFSPFFTDKNSVFQFLKPSQKALLCYEKTNDGVAQFTFITKISPSLFQIDSLEGIQQTQISFAGKTIQKIQYKEREVFSIQWDSIFMLSTSEGLIKESLEGKTKNEPTFLKALKLKNDEELAYVTQLNEGDTLPIWASWASFELQLLPDGLVGNGVLLEQDSLLQLLSVFKGQVPQKNEAPTIIPVKATKAHSFTFQNMAAFQKNLQKYKKDSLNLDPTFETINEVVEIQMEGQPIVCLKSLDPQITWDYLAKYISEKETFREVPLFEFTEETPFFGGFSPLLTNTSYRIVFQWEDFFVFTQSQTIAEQLIADYQNHTVLASAPFFESANTQLAQASSFTAYSLQGKVEGLFRNFWAERLHACHTSLW
ncbi:MAG: hypothetical protein R2793_04195 [Flavobacteriaceae bacterium]